MGGPNPRKLVVARGGIQTALSPEEEAAADAALASTLKLLGGRDVMISTLSVASAVPEVEDLLRLLLDPRYDKLSLKRLCTMAGITVVDLFTTYRKAMVARAQLVALNTITEKILPVVEDVMQRAAPYKIPCFNCGATGEILNGDAPPSVCPQCGGRKEVLQLPDLDRQKLALELAQLVQKSGGININQSQMNVVPPKQEDEEEGPGATLIGLQHALRELQSGPRVPLQIVEATVVSDPTPEPQEETT